MTRQTQQDMPVEDDKSHVVNVGKLVEDMEGKMRNLLRQCCSLGGVDRAGRLTYGRGGVFREGEGCCGGVEKYCCPLILLICGMS